MHLALIIDQERLSQEQTMLNRLCIGLMVESVQLTRIVPENLPAEHVDEGEQRIALAARIEAPMGVLPWMRRSRVSQIIDALEKGLPDVLYAIGEKAWQVGADLARATDRPLVIDVFSMSQMKAIRHWRGGTAASIAGYIASCEPVAQALRQRVDAALVSVVPMGVAVPALPRNILADDQEAIALAIIGAGQDRVAYEVVLRGLSQVAPQVSNLQVFLELRGSHEHDIWRQAEELDLLGVVSAIGEAPLYRALLTRCDVLLMPEPDSEPRSIMLEAMALGMPVIAAENPVLDTLIDGETAVLITQNNPEVWASGIWRLLSNREAARTLGLRGRQAVAERHRSSDQVAGLLETLQKTLSGGALQFRKP